MSTRTSNRPRAERRRDEREARHHPQAPPSRKPWPWIVLAAFVLIAAVVAVLASRDSGGSSTATGIEQTRPVTVTGTALPAYDAAAATDAAVGTVIPTVQGQSFDGSAVGITSGAAKVIAFVAHWCPHCQKEVPLISGYLMKTPMPAGVQLVTVATGTNPDRPNYPPSLWLDREEWPGPVLADDTAYSAGQAFGLSSYPYFVAVSAEGKVVARASGELTIDQFTALVEKARTA